MLIKPLVFCVFIILCMTLTTTAIKPDLYVESEIGIQNGVPDTENDTRLGTYPFCALQLEPSLQKSSGNTTTYALSLPINALKYIGGTGDFTFGPELSFGKSLDHSTIEILSAATYTYMPAAFDPTIPENYLEWLLQYDQRSIETRSFGGNYAISLLREIGTERFDVNNHLHATANLALSATWQLFFKFGCAWNLSNFKGGGYLQPNAAGGATCIFNKKSMLLTQLFGSYSFYETARIPVQFPPGKSKKGKKNKPSMNDTTTSDMPFATLYTDYNRELSSGTHIHFMYMLTLFGRGNPISVNLSHQLAVMLDWSNN